MLDYQILQYDDITTLEKYVRYNIKFGWIPLGGVAIGTGENVNHSKLYLQAMTRNKE